MHYPSYIESVLVIPACLQALDSNVNHKQVLKQVKHNMI